MTQDPKTEDLELSVEQLDEANGGATIGSAGAVENLAGNNTLIGMLLPAVQKVREA
jgi:hypothetical protein